MLHTTFGRAKEARACIGSYRKFAKYKGGINKWGKDTPFGLDEVLEVCGLDDALWTLRIVLEPADKEIRLFMCDCAERVLPIFEKVYHEDKRPRQTIEISRKFALGKATSNELEAAREMMRAVTGATIGATTGEATREMMRAAAGAAWAEAWAAAWAAWVATWAATGEAIGAAWVATWAATGAAWAATWAAWAVTGAATGEAWVATGEAIGAITEREWQKARFVALLKKEV